VSLLNFLCFADAMVFPVIRKSISWYQKLHLLYKRNRVLIDIKKSKKLNSILISRIKALDQGYKEQ
jgi:hypothetical protein